MAKANSKTKTETTETETAGNRILRKITVRDTMGAEWMKKEMLDAVEAKKGKTLWLCTIIGVVGGFKPGSTDKGEFIRLNGQFKSTNLLTGEQFRCGSAILPGFVSEPIAAQVKSGGADIQFAIKIGAHYDETSVTKYVYDVASLIAPQENDALAMLEQQAGIKALPAPSA